MPFRTIYRGCGGLWWSFCGGKTQAGTARFTTLHKLRTRYICYWHGTSALSLEVLQYAPICSTAHGVALPPKTKSAIKSGTVDIRSKECSNEEVFTDVSYRENRKDGRIKSYTNKVTVREKVVQRMISLFDITRDEALLILKSPEVQQISEKAILNTMHFLKDHNISSQQIQRIPWILSHSEDSLQQKFPKLTELYLFRNYSEGLGFCYFPLERIAAYQRSFLSEAANFPNHNNRIYYLAEKLKVPVECLTEKIVKPHRILSMKMKLLEHRIDIFQRYGIHSEDILADLWVFTYSSKKAEERLQRAVEIGSQVLKPWMCRCPSYIFDRYCERFNTGKLLFNKHKDIKGYLSEKLQCEPELVDRLFQSNFLLKKVHITKFERVIDLLFSEGLTPQEVRSCMKVFQYSEKRTAARIRKLKQIGFFPFPLTILSKTPRQFGNFVAHYEKVHGLQSHEKDMDTL